MSILISTPFTKSTREETIMTYQEVLENARAVLSKNCKACPVCNGKACGKQHRQQRRYAEFTLSE